MRKIGRHKDAMTLIRLCRPETHCERDLFKNEVPKATTRARFLLPRRIHVESAGYASDHLLSFDGSSRMRQSRRSEHSLFLVWLILAVCSPVHAYGDPSGGGVFQILTPILATLWAMWMILAGGIVRRFSKFVRRVRRTHFHKPADHNVQHGEASASEPACSKPREGS